MPTLVEIHNIDYRIILSIIYLFSQKGASMSSETPKATLCIIIEKRTFEKRTGKGFQPYVRTVEITTTATILTPQTVESGAIT